MVLFLAVIIILCIVIFVFSSAKSIKYGDGNSVSVKFQDSDSGRTIHAGNGNSIGSAMADGFRKMADSVSDSSSIDTLQSKVDVMHRTLSTYRDNMRESDIQACSSYLHRVERILNEKKRIQQEKQARYARERQEKEEARKQRARMLYQERKRKEAEAEAARLEKEKNMDAQHRFVAQQRRLMTDSLRYDVLKRDGFRCQICGATAKDGYKLHVDHIMPVSKGGKTELSNLRTLCERCNMGKSDKLE